MTSVGKIQTAGLRLLKSKLPQNSTISKAIQSYSRTLSNGTRVQYGVYIYNNIPCFVKNLDIKDGRRICTSWSPTSNNNHYKRKTDFVIRRRGEVRTLAYTSKDEKTFRAVGFYNEKHHTIQTPNLISSGKLRSVENMNISPRFFEDYTKNHTIVKLTD